MKTIPVGYMETEWVGYKTVLGQISFDCLHPSVHQEQIDYGRFTVDSSGEMDWVEDYHVDIICNDCQENLEQDIEESHYGW